MKNFYFALLAMLATLPACTKTETVPYLPATGNQLLEYKIVNVQGNPIYGAINQADTIVTVYLPFYLQLTSLEPAIKVSEGATVTPASGTMIENLLEVFRTGRTIRYEVKSKDGKIKSYKLDIQVQQPAVTLEEVSKEADKPNEYVIDMKKDYDSFSFSVNGTGFASSQEMISAVLVDEANKEYGPLPMSTFNTTDLTYLNFVVTKYKPGQSSEILATLPATGLYRVRVYSYAKVATTQNPIRITLLNK